MIFRTGLISTNYNSPLWGWAPKSLLPTDRPQQHPKGGKGSLCKWSFAAAASSVLNHARIATPMTAYMLWISGAHVFSRVVYRTCNFLPKWKYFRERFTKMTLKAVLYFANVTFDLAFSLGMYNETKVEISIYCKFMVYTLHRYYTPIFESFK